MSAMLQTGSALETLDTVLRLMAVGGALTLAASIAVNRSARALKLSLLGVLLCSAAYTLNSSPLLEPAGIAGLAVELAALFVPFFTWLFARFLFERPPPRWIALGWAAGLVLCWFGASFVPPTRGLVFTAIHIGSLAFMVDVFRIAWSGRADDLVEKRRLLRLGLPVSVGLLASFILLTEFLTGIVPFVLPLRIGVAATVLGLLFFAAIVLFDPDEVLSVQPGADIPDDETDALSPAEQVLRDRLEAAMSKGYYRTAGLTIPALAAHLETPEHRLRALINQRLGYRNFSSFLNHHRIAEARQLLTGADTIDLPVTTIAMDLGYNALPTFNRAFRDATGTTPSDYRKAEFGQ